MRGGIALDDIVALLDDVAILKVDVPPFGIRYSPVSSLLSVGSMVMRRLFL